MTSVEPTRGPSWPPIVVLAGVFVLGAVLGAFGWSYREQAAELSAVALETSLVAGPVTAELAEDGAHRLVAGVHNLGPRDITVLEARPSGWTVTDDATHPTTVPVGEWAGVPLVALPDCGIPARSELDLLVGTERGDHRVTLPLQPDGDALGRLRQVVCREYERVGVVMEDVEVVATEDGELDMHLALRHVGPPSVGELTVPLVRAPAPGFRATGTDLPVVLLPGGTAVATVRWTVHECDRTEDLAGVRLVIRLESSAVVSWHVRLPGRAVAALARHATTECASSL